jgi:hypothetical protein
MNMKTEYNTAGRPTSFKSEYIELGHNYSLLGATDSEMATFFGVAESTINLWKLKQPKFKDALIRGKAVADAHVAKALYTRAIGYSHAETHVSNYQGEITITQVTKHYPPDSVACFFWLKNRQPDKWRDKIEVNNNIKVDKKMMDFIETQFVTRMEKAHERQREVLRERGISDDS